MDPTLETINNTELKQLLQEHETLLQELSNRKKIRGINFYVPNKIQYNAHKSTCKTIAIVKGNRMGGSTWGAVEITYHITKQYPEWYPYERRFKGPLKIRIATDKFFKIDSVIEPKLRQFLPKGEIVRTRRSPQGYIQKLHTKDGTTIEFLSSEQDQMAWEGQDLDVFWGDEPMKRSHWVGTKRGLLDRGGCAIFTFTPLIEPWMKEEIVDKADGKSIDVFYGSTRDNLFDIQGNQILREEDVKDFESILTPEERETRIEGKFFHLKGVVYSELDATTHCVASFTYENGYPVVCVLDPHDRQPHWVIWAMIDRINDVYVMYEMIRKGTIKELAAMILATEKYFGWNMTKRLIDPNFGRSNLLTTGRSVIQELGFYKCVFTEAYDNKEYGHLKVKEYLHYDKSRAMDIDNKPKLFFVKDKTPLTWHSMVNYQHDEWKGKTANDRDPKEDTKPKDDHGASCVRYLIASQPSFYAPSVYEPQLQEAYY